MIRCERVTDANFAKLGDLFSTSRECGLCWCMNHRLPPRAEVQGENAKRALQNLVSEGKVFGVLALDQEQCVGWCAVDPLRDQPGHDYNHWKHRETDPGTWSIHCFYVHPQYRGQGISTQLAREAVSLAKSEGAKRILAFPIPEEMREKFPVHDGEFSGRYSTFVKVGFRPSARVNDFYAVLSLDPVN